MTQQSSPPVAYDDRQLAERALVAQLRAGESRAFVTLVTEHANRLTRFAFHLTKSRDIAEDVVQHVFVQVWERRSLLDAECKLSAYLFRAVRNRVLNELSAESVRQRHTARMQAEVEHEGREAITASPEDQILTAAEIQHAVDQLSERRALAVRLRLEEGLSHAEIAEVFGISPAAAQSLVARAVADLRKLLWGA